MTSRSGTTTHSNSLSSKRQKAKFTPPNVRLGAVRSCSVPLLPEGRLGASPGGRHSRGAQRPLVGVLHPGIWAARLSGRPRRSVPGYEREETDCRLPLVTRFLPAPLVARRSAPMSSEVAPGGAPWSRYPTGAVVQKDATSNPSLRVESFRASFLVTSVCRRDPHAANE